MKDSIKKGFFKYFYKLLSIIYPPRCIACDGVLEPWEYDNGVCSDCLRKGQVILAREPVCKKCGKPLKDEFAELCENCRGRKHEFTQGKAVLVYAGGVREGMYRFKYSNRRCYARTYAGIAVKLHGRWLRRIQPDAVIPVPMYKPKEKKRGYNQAAVFAEALSREIGVPCYRDILIRNRDTLPQKLLGAAERQKNLKNAFQIGHFGVKLKQVLLVDDIYTTGATMDEASKALLAAGVEKVYILTVCAGESADSAGRGKPADRRRYGSQDM